MKFFIKIKKCFEGVRKWVLFIKIVEFIKKILKTKNAEKRKTRTESEEEKPLHTRLPFQQPERSKAPFAAAVSVTEVKGGFIPPQKKASYDKILIF